MPEQANLPFVRSGDHPALDFLNTVLKIDGRLVDLLESDQDVLRWLSETGMPVENQTAKLRSSALIQAARSLRETIRTLVERRKAHKKLDLSTLNAFLAQARSSIQLVAAKDDSLHIERHWENSTPEQILAPIAESAAELFATADFNLVKPCESPDCVLWFYDRTRSHHRRWCSMAVCGNRQKVAAFRKRRA
ncbi:MAG TPA: ABATE domain-containing protein [Edaphobacter sp.]|nr:ABATE domain-containing protein [Edaphobacter sp.]